MNKACIFTYKDSCCVLYCLMSPRLHQDMTSDFRDVEDFALSDHFWPGVAGKKNVDREISWLRHLSACIVFLTVPNFIEKKTDTLNTATRETLLRKNLVISFVVKNFTFCFSECCHVLSTHAQIVKVNLSSVTPDHPSWFISPVGKLFSNKHLDPNNLITVIPL